MPVLSGFPPSKSYKSKGAVVGKSETQYLFAPLVPALFGSSKIAETDKPRLSQLGSDWVTL